MVCGIILYANIINMCLTLYVPKYFDYKSRMKMEINFQNESNKKNKEKVYGIYYTRIVLIETFFFLLSIILGILFTNLKQIDKIIQIEMDLIVWRKKVRYLLFALAGITLVVAFIKDFKNKLKDQKKYNIAYTGPIPLTISFFRTYGLPTLFITLSNILDALVYQYTFMSMSYLYYFNISIFIIILVSLMMFNKFDKKFLQYNFLVTILYFIIFISIAFIINCLFILI